MVAAAGLPVDQPPVRTDLFPIPVYGILGARISRRADLLSIKQRNTEGSRLFVVLTALNYLTRSPQVVGTKGTKQGLGIGGAYGVPHKTLRVGIGR